MKNQILASLCFLSAILLSVQKASAQGPLTPPGPPGPTMITLSQVEPRTPISALPATITVSGSYYVTSNMTCTACTNAVNGITIATNDVTVDLSGFTLRGVAGSGTGITVLNPEKNLAIRNGVLDGWGLNASTAYNSRFEQLRESNSAGSGLDAGSNCVVLACSVAGNAEGGIVAGNNCTIKDCASSDNGILYTSIQVSNNCTVIGCNASGSNDGIVVFGNNSAVIACNVSGNFFQGIHIDSQSYCTVKDCTSSGNGADGINCVCNGCLVTGNTCSSNTAYGIYIYGGQNRIDGNTCVNNAGYGINPSFANVTNTITRNAAPGNVLGGYGNYAGNSDYAPTGAVNTATNPWTNF